MHVPCQVFIHVRNLCFIPHSDNVKVYNALSCVLHVVGVHIVSLMHKHVLQHVSGTCSHFSSISFGLGDDTADRSDPTVQHQKREIAACLFLSGVSSGLDTTTALINPPGRACEAD